MMVNLRSNLEGLACQMEMLGVKIDNLTMEEALDRMESFLKDGKQHYIVTPNPEFLVKAHQEEEFRQILNQADLAVPDGVGLILAARFLGQPLKERITGTDLMEKLCQRAAQKKWLVFLLGGEEGVAEKAAENLRRKYGQLKIQSFRNEAGKVCGFGPTAPKSRPAILFVALGISKQEKWIVENLTEMPQVKLAVGVGGAFDFISGQVKRAPRFLQQIGLEWSWRLMKQPWRIKRIFKAVIIFPWLVIKSRSRVIHN